MKANPLGIEDVIEIKGRMIAREDEEGKPVASRKTIFVGIDRATQLPVAFTLEKSIQGRTAVSIDEVRKIQFLQELREDIDRALRRVKPIVSLTPEEPPATAENSR